MLNLLANKIFPPALFLLGHPQPLSHRSRMTLAMDAAAPPPSNEQLPRRASLLPLPSDVWPTRALWLPVDLRLRSLGLFAWRIDTSTGGEEEERWLPMTGSDRGHMSKPHRCSTPHGPWVAACAPPCGSLCVWRMGREVLT
jgi:hypothetical protein